jgi:hypothetical protein
MHQDGILEAVHGRGEEAVGPRDLVAGFKSLAQAVEGRREGRFKERSGTFGGIGTSPIIQNTTHFSNHHSFL